MLLWGDSDERDWLMGEVMRRRAAAKEAGERDRRQAEGMATEEEAADFERRVAKAEREGVARIAHGRSAVGSHRG